MGRRGPGIFIKSLFVLALAAGFGVAGYSQDTSKQEARKARLQKEIEILDNQLKANASKSANALSNLTLVRKKVSSRKELVAESDRLIASYSDSIASKEKQIRATQNRLDTLSHYYNKLIRGAYKNRNAKVWYMYILASDNVGQAMRRYGYLRDLSEQMNLQGEKIRTAQEELRVQKENLDAMKKDAEAVRAQRLAEVNQLQKEETQSKSIVNQLNRDKKKYQQQLTKKRNEMNALNREIEKIIRDAMEAEDPKSAAKGKKSTDSKPRKPIDYTLAKQFEGNKGKLPWPAEGPVVDKFGQHYHPVYTKVLLPFNNGITIAVAPETAVKSVFDGEVKQIVVMPGYSKCVLVQHGNYFSFYCKLGNVAVKAGDKVKTGQTIGTVDTIDGETQLHFQIWSGRTPQNPEIWLRP